MGNGASVVMDADMVASSNLNHLLGLDWSTIFDKVAIKDLSKVQGGLQKIMDHFATSKEKKLDEAFGTLPPEAQALCDATHTHGSAEHLELITATVPYVVSIAPHAHLSKRLKKNLRQILGLGFAFTRVLDAVGTAWDDMKNGCVSHMRALGQQLDDKFQEQELGARLGTFTAEQAPHHPKLRQIVPPQCGPGMFSDDLNDKGRQNDLECTYIHFLRLIALALDGAFQKAVSEVLCDAGLRLVGGKVSSGGIKGYERMVNKMLSFDDHRKLPKPRPAHNIDVVRCLATFETPQDMLQGFEVVKTVFDDGKYANFKNGMAWPAEVAESRFHLRIVLATGRFSIPRKTTMRELRHDPHTRNIWSSYLEEQEQPPSVARGSWKRHATEALKWIEAMPDDAPVSMLCEVQMLLRDYHDVRTGMHELYKIVRAVSPTSLSQDFAKHRRALDLSKKLVVDGDTDLKATCRDGIHTALQQLLSNTTSAEHAEGLCIACEYVRPRCVELLLAHVKDPSDLGKALYYAAKGTASRASFQLDPERRRIAERLVEAKADLNTMAVAFQETETYAATAVTVAAENGHVDTLSTLLAAKADVDHPTHRGWTPSYMAAFNGHSDCLASLISAKADVDKDADNKITPTFIAAQNGHFDCLALLIAAKADVRRVRGDDSPPTAMAVQAGHSNCLSLLLAAKSDADSTIAGNSTLMHMAASGGQLDCLSVLISAKAGIDTVDDQGTTSIYRAAGEGRAEAVRMLLDAKGDPSIPDTRGWTPLHSAAGNGSLAVLKLLLGAKAPVDVKATGETPLSWAKKHSRDACVELLVAAGAVDMDVGGLV